MGNSTRKASLDDIKVKVKRGSTAPCGPELMGYLGCLDANNANDAQCASIRFNLERCMKAAGARPQKLHKPPLNYFLQQVRFPYLVCRLPQQRRASLRCRPGTTPTSHFHVSSAATAAQSDTNPPRGPAPLTPDMRLPPVLSSSACEILQEEMRGSLPPPLRAPYHTTERSVQLGGSRTAGRQE